MLADTDECNQNSTEELKMLCHTDAYCINTIGSYLCRCNNGFNGDGFRYCKGNFNFSEYKCRKIVRLCKLEFNSLFVVWSLIKFVSYEPKYFEN